jgi:Yip1-like protein
MKGELLESTSWTDSPYVGICIRPRATIREIVDRDPRDRVIALVLVAAVIGALASAVSGYRYDPTAFTIAGKPIPLTAPHTSRMIRLWTLVLVPVLAVPLLYINGALLRWTGSLLGGTAKPVEVRAAIAWPRVMAIVIALLGFVLGLVMPPPPQPPATHSVHVLLASLQPRLPSMIILAPFWLWSFIVSLECLGEVHRFSAWRALGAVIIWLLVVAGAIVVVILVLGTIRAVASAG